MSARSPTDSGSSCTTIGTRSCCELCVESCTAPNPEYISWESERTKSNNTGITFSRSSATRYVEFDERNFECFSIEIGRVILASGAEVDVVCQQICQHIDGNSPADNIHKYRDAIMRKYPNIAHFEIQIPRFGLTLKPWDEWRKADGVPRWWTAYNKIKHQRDSEYARANFKNALNSAPIQS